MSLINPITSTLRSALPPCLSTHATHAVGIINHIANWSKVNIKLSDAGYSMLLSTPVNTSGITTLFTNAIKKFDVEGIHRYWTENGLSCESLTSSNTKEVFKECYSGAFEGGRLLKQVCTDTDTPSENPYLRGQVLGAILLFEAFRSFQNEKIKSIFVGTLGAACIFITNFDI